MKKILPALFLAFLALPTAAAAGADAAGEFGAMATVETRQGTRSLALTIVVTNPMTPEQALPLKKVLESGQQALLNSIRGASRGRFRLGAVEYPINLVVAEPTQNGMKYVVVTERSLRVEEVNESRPSLDYPFTVLVFEVPEFGAGEGRVFTQAALRLDAEGHPRVDQYEHQPGTLKDIRRTKAFP